MAQFKKVPGAGEGESVAPSPLWTTSVELMGTTVPVWLILLGVGVLAFLLFVFGMWERDPKSKDIEGFHPKHRGE
ncbi:MAG: hypothetical protein AAGC79_14315 [Pseudomonadota bacterium]